jgi:hypothetical protein
VTSAIWLASNRLDLDGPWPSRIDPARGDAAPSTHPPAFRDAIKVAGTENIYRMVSWPLANLKMRHLGDDQRGRLLSSCRMEPSN